MSLLLYSLLALAVVGAILGFIVNWSMAPTSGRRIAEYQNPRKALLVVDVQEDFTGETAPASSPYKNSPVFLATVNEVIAKAANKDMLVVYIGQEFPNNFLYRIAGRGLTLRGKAGTRQDDRLNLVSSYYFSKSRSDAFSNCQLEQFLIDNKVNEVYIVGLDAAFCVYKTALGALNRNYKVMVIIDAVTTFKKTRGEEIAGMYRRKGIGSAVSGAVFGDLS
jgi:nicotinamidase-related amidase